MNSHTDRNLKSKDHGIAKGSTEKQSIGKSAFQLVDNRPKSIAQRKQKEVITNGPQAEQTNNTLVIQRVKKWPLKTRVNVNLDSLKDKHPDFFGLRSGTIVRYVTDTTPIIRFDHPLPNGNIQQAFGEELVTAIGHEERRPVTSTSDLVTNAFPPGQAAEMLTTPSEAVDPSRYSGGRPIGRGKRGPTKVSSWDVGPPPERLREGFGDIEAGRARPKTPTDRGLVIGEWHHDVAPKKWLIQQFKSLHDQGFRVLFMEHLFTDQNAEELDKLAGIRKPVPSAVVKPSGKPSKLEERLEELNSGHNVSGPGAKKFNYVTVIQEAVRAGIRVIPIDATRTYWGYNHTKGRNRHYALNYPASVMINYYARHHLKSNEKWIAFVGARHMVTQADVLKEVEVQDNAPGRPAMGIAELTGGRPLLIESNPEIPQGHVAESSSRQVKKGTEAPDENRSPTAFTRLEMGTGDH